MKRTLFYIIMMLFVSIIGYAQQNPKNAAKAEQLYQKGVAMGAWNEKTHCMIDPSKKPAVRYSTVFTYYKQAADLGHPEAMYRVGAHYHFGHGVSQNSKLMYEYYKKAADLGHGVAAYWWAFNKEEEGGLKDHALYPEIIKYYEIAIMYGIPKKAEDTLDACQAMYRVGKHYMDKGDYKNAYDILRRCESYTYEKGDSKYVLSTMMLLAELYYFGNGCQKDYQKAHSLYSKVYNANKSTYAGSYLAAMYYFGQGGEQNYSKALSYVTTASDDAYRDVYHYALGHMYLYGNGVASDFDKARHHLEYASGNGYEDATKLLAKFDEVKASVNKRLEEERRAAELKKQQEERERKAAELAAERKRVEEERIAAEKERKYQEQIRINSNINLWHLGDLLCRRFTEYSSTALITATLEGWNENKSRAHVRIVTSPSSTAKLHGELMEKNNVIWVDARGDGWHLATTEEKENAEGRDNSAHKASSSSSSQVIHVHEDKTCEYCNGRGTRPCSVCDGTGVRTFIWHDDEICDECHGKGSIKCWYCNGSGRKL